MTVRLRAHHLLCLLTYRGVGYSPAFVDNFDEICRRLTAGEDVSLVEGPDDICAPLCAAEGADCHCLGASVTGRDGLARAALADDLPTDGILVLTPARIADWRRRFADGQIRAACAGCQWFDLCSDVAQSGFVGVRLAEALDS